MFSWLSHPSRRTVRIGGVPCRNAPREALTCRAVDGEGAGTSPLGACRTFETRALVRRLQGGPVADRRTTESRKTYVLDTSVLLSDPGAWARFGEHEVVLPLW